MGTGAFERYIEVIYSVEKSEGEVRVKDIAAALGVSLPSVSEMLDRLVDSSLVTHDKYGHIELTGKGKRIAKGLNRKHEVIRDFFVNVLEIDEDVADADACEIEHVISDATLNGLVDYLEAHSP